MRTWLYWLLLILAGVGAANASEMNLSQAVETALKNSPKVQRSQSQADEASWKRVEAFSTYLPSVSAQASYLTNYKYVLTDVPFGATPVTVPNILPTAVYSLQVQYNLFDGLASTNRYRASKAFEDSSQKDLEWTRFQLEREVTLQFYKTMASRTLKTVAEQNLKTLEDHLKEIALFKKAGISTKFDVLRVEVQVSEARSEMLNAQDNVEIAQGHLAEVLGQEDPIAATGELPALQPELIAAMKEGFAGRADLASLNEKVRGLDAMESAGNRYWIPKVSLSGAYQYYNNRNDRVFDSDSFRDAYTVGVNLSWNVFDGLASHAKAHESAEQRIQAEKTLQLVRLKAKQDVDYWKRKFVYFCTVYQSRQSDILKAQESVRLAREERRVGSRTNTELLDAEAELNRAQAGAVNAQIGSIEALINLELATGQPITKFN